MTAVCLESLTAITSSVPKHFNTAATASAQSTLEEADKNACREWVRWIRGDERGANWTGGW